MKDGVYRSGLEVYYVHGDFAFICYPERNLDVSGKDIAVSLDPARTYEYIGTVEEYTARVGYVEGSRYDSLLDKCNSILTQLEESLAREKRLLEVIEYYKSIAEGAKKVTSPKVLN